MWTRLLAEPDSQLFGHLPRPCAVWRKGLAMSSSLAALLAPEALLVAGVVVSLVVVIWLLYLASSITRNVRLMRRQLERLNDTLDHRGPDKGSGVLGL